MSCKGQDVKKDSVKGNYSSIENHIYFLPNSLELDLHKQGKVILDRLGKNIKNKNIDFDKYTILFGVSSNDEELKANKYLDANRVVFIMNYLKDNYGANNSMFLVEFEESTLYKSSAIIYVLIDKNE